jgi:hypothetical protein
MMLRGLLQGTSVEARPVPTARELYLSPARLEPRRQEEVELAFFNSLRTNRVYKTTYARRLDDLNRLVEAHLPAEKPLRIMDTAVSSGITTAEWVASLSEARIDHCMTAGDLSVQAYLLSFSSNLHVLVDATGHPLQYEVRGRAIPGTPGKRNWLRYFPQLLCMKVALRASLPQLRALVRQEARPSRGCGVVCHAIPLVSPALTRLANVSVLEDDLRVYNPALAGRFHVIRAANILNRGYFDADTLVTMLRNLRTRLQRHGLLVVCRTAVGGDNHATLFRLKESGRFGVQARLGNGSEIESLVLGLAP